MSPHREGEPRHHRQWLHAYTNISASGDVGTTMDVIGKGTYGLRQRCRRIKEASPDNIHIGSPIYIDNTSH
jgi:hypothetical protein